ncbi:hypothetical protein RUM44_006633 [Polyplax serrata]|uniref:LAGLIDADG homing endonuclease n=1 Tax=Polyplax serrata TaxID=468196 RepID=A0ABR1AK71_POLSC
MILLRLIPYNSGYDPEETVFDLGQKVFQHTLFSNFEWNERNHHRKEFVKYEVSPFGKSSARLTAKTEVIRLLYEFCS